MIASDELVRYVADVDDAATLYRRNAFRTLDLDVTATPNDVVRKKSRLERRLRLGIDASRSLDDGVAASSPNEETLGHALHRLSEPAFRLLDESLWFWGGEGSGGDPRLAQAIAAFRSGAVDVATGLWRELAQAEGPTRVVAIHDHAVAVHQLAIEGDAAGAEAERSALSHWSDARALWDQVCEGGCARLSSRLRDRVRQIDDPRYPGRLAEAASDRVPVLVAWSFATRARAWHRAGRTEAARKLLDELERSALPAEAKDEARRLIFEPLRRRTTERVSATRSIAGMAPERALDLARTLLDDGRKLVEEMRLLLPAGHSMLVAVGNEIAEAVLLAQVEYGRTVEDWRRSEELLLAARELIHGEQIQERLRTNIDAVRGNGEFSGFWHDPADPIAGEALRDVLTALAPGGRKGDWDGAVDAVEALIARAAAGEVGGASEPALARVHAFALARRGLTRIGQLNEILERPTAVMTKVRGRIRKLGSRHSDRLLGSFAAFTANYLRLGHGLVECGACAKSFGSHGQSVTVLTIDGVEALLCDVCAAAHSGALAAEKRELAPIYRAIVRDLCWSRELAPGPKGVESQHAAVREGATKAGVALDGCSPRDLRKRLKNLRKGATSRAPEAGAGSGARQDRPAARSAEPQTARSGAGTAILVVFLLAAIAFCAWIVFSRERL